MGGQYDFTPRPPRSTITRVTGSRSSWSDCSPLAFLAWLHLVKRRSSQCSPRNYWSTQARPPRQGGSFRSGLPCLALRNLAESQPSQSGKKLTARTPLTSISRHFLQRLQPNIGRVTGTPSWKVYNTINTQTLSALFHALLPSLALAASRFAPS
ncbi:hypothetical protein CSKR_110793 [Clonorchis sinensis]|uniref:Uncharacterized protein n=1 Tax=Clonorchis sinensis TaxID=79923 RepID=A0A3R7CIJ7_CLOSI|nr:hypothetical protein CSKR_110793 [Clonorchis sinensis]